MVSLWIVFDAMRMEGALIKLHNASYNGRMFYWTKIFLTIGLPISKLGANVQKLRTNENGMPQWSVIYPVIFTIMINDIFKKLTKSSFGLQMMLPYGTEGEILVILFIKFKSCGHDCWVGRWVFKISISKYKFMVWGFKRGIPDLNISLYECPLEN